MSDGRRENDTEGHTHVHELQAVGDAMAQKISRHLHDSIAYDLNHRTADLDPSMQYARGVDRSKADTFAGMHPTRLVFTSSDTERPASGSGDVGVRG